MAENQKKIEDIAKQQQEWPAMNAFVVPAPLFMQMVELIRGNATHRDAQPIMDQVSQLQPQQVRVAPG